MPLHEWISIARWPNRRIDMSDFLLHTSLSFLDILDNILDNNYPLNFIFQIHERFKYLIYKSNNKDKIKDNNNDKPVRYFTVSFLPSVSEKFSHLTRNIDRLSYFSFDKLNKLIKGHKDLYLRHYQWMSFTMLSVGYRSIVIIAMRPM